MSGSRPPSEVTDSADLTEDAAGDGCGEGRNERAPNAPSTDRPRSPNCGILHAFFRVAGSPANTTFTSLPDRAVCQGTAVRLVGAVVKALDRQVSTCRA